jgi:hypothetical protein
MTRRLYPNHEYSISDRSAVRVEIPLAANSTLGIWLSRLPDVLRDMLKIKSSQSKVTRMLLIPLAQLASKLRRLGFVDDLPTARSPTGNNKRDESQRSKLMSDSRLQAGQICS